MMFRRAAVLAVLAASPAALGQLVINEVDYDSVGADTTEFVEIRNGFNCPVSLDLIDLVFINGANNTEYRRINLGQAGTLQPGQYLVIRDTAVPAPPPPALDIIFTALQDNIQNGSPDAIALVDTAHARIIDCLSYEGDRVG